MGLFLLVREGLPCAEDIPAGYLRDLPRDGEARKAYEALVAHNMRLVYSVVKGMAHGNDLDLDDLAQYGVIGLTRAVEKFDIARGFKFSTYATSWIRQSADRAVADFGAAIRLPVHVRDSVRKITRVQRDSRARGIEPDVVDLQKATGFSHEKVASCLKLSRRTKSLDALVEIGFPESAISDYRGASTTPHHSLRQYIALEELRPLLSVLNERTLLMIMYRYGLVDGERWTLEEVGRLFGVTRERVRQLEVRGLSDMRIALGLEPDKPGAAGRMKRAQREWEALGNGLASRVRRANRRASRRGRAAVENRSAGSRNAERAGNAMTVDEGSFGHWLKEQMVHHGTDEAELAQRLDVPQFLISSWLEGRSVPNDGMRVKVEALFDVLEEAEAGTSEGDDIGNVGWRHRPAHQDGGREFGNAAAFAFDADVEVLAREATQNSLDERLPNSRPVRVHYTLHELTGEWLARFREALRWEDLLPHYQVAAAQNQKVGRVIAAGLREMEERDRLVLLRVDDYNASGLTGDDYETGRFAAVVRRQLDSHKSTNGAGGSYGLGKATLWATSRLGLVLMNSTLSEPHEGRTERRLVGRLDLPWREVGGTPCAGPAWFGRPDPDLGDANVARSWWADRDTVERLHLTRESAEPGTSFLIVGAHDVASLAEAGPAEDDASDDADSVHIMHRRLVQALGRNFWAAMTPGGSGEPLLEVSVRTLRNGEVIIEKERVDPRVAQPSRTRALQAFLDGTTVERLTESGQVAMTTVPLKVPDLAEGPGGGEHRAVLLVTEADDADGRPNTVVAMRGNRMTVKTSRVPDLALGTNPFQAVLLVGQAAGDVRLADEAEAFLRASEPPEHNKWGQTEELRMRYSPSAYRRIAALTRDTNKAVRELVALPKEKRRSGSDRLRKRLTVGGRKEARSNETAGLPTLDDLEARIDDDGAWCVTAEVKVPAGGDSWQLTPVAKLDVRSGARPVVSWAELVAVRSCEVVDGVLRFAPGARSATFRGVTDVSTHPVRATLTGLVVELSAGKGGKA